MYNCLTTLSKVNFKGETILINGYASSNELVNLSIDDLDTKRAEYIKSILEENSHELPEVKANGKIKNESSIDKASLNNNKASDFKKQRVDIILEYEPSTILSELFELLLENSLSLNKSLKLYLLIKKSIY